MGKPKGDCQKVESLTGSQTCVFCHTAEIDEMKYGPIYMHKNIITHYFCLLLSSNMEQNGRDCDGILGFIAADIQKEVRRGTRLHCTYCRQSGATLGCAVAKCKVVFHLPCGIKHSTLHQFFGEFKSFCNKHRPVQIISEKILANSSKGAMCGICYEKVVPRPIHETLWAPCCQKNAFFHRECVQQLAISAGYFFKCPLCNNTETFQQAMKEFGIYIPEQDASWECVPQAYQDLLVRHDTCDSASCSCPSGRKTNVQGTRWELILCKFCGSQGIHIGCGRLKWKSPEFECDICSSASNEANQANTRNYNGNRHRLSTGRRDADTHTLVSVDRELSSSEDSSDDDSALVTLSNQRRRVSPPPPHPNRRVTPPLSRRKDVSPSPEPRRRIVSPEPRRRVLSPPGSEHRRRNISPVPDHRKRHVSPSPEYRKRNKSPLHGRRDKSPPRKHSRKHKQHRSEKGTSSTIVIDDDFDDRFARKSIHKSIVIDDSDDDIEEVTEVTASGGCLKTNEGVTIPVVQVDRHSLKTQRKFSVEGDVNVLPPKVLDVSVQMPNQKPKLASPPPIKELVYSLPPQPQPSTSAQSMLPPVFVPPDSGPYVIVDPSTLRPEDLPVGTVLYRSMQPVTHVPGQMPMQPQMPMQSHLPQQIQSPLPTPMPMPYFSCDANSSNWGPPVMQMPNIQISVNTGPGSATVSTPSTSRSITRKHIERSNVIVVDDDEDPLDVITID